jgi:hypothetical protein
MKTKKGFDSVKMMRDIRDKMSLEIANMNTVELKEYFSKRKEGFEKKYNKSANNIQRRKTKSQKVSN